VVSPHCKLKIALHGGIRCATAKSNIAAQAGARNFSGACTPLDFCPPRRFFPMNK
jgi:isopropylmalate/homocitrate/citramalate synthase